MTRDELLAQLRDLAGPGDTEIAHSLADEALIAFIDDEEIKAAFDAIDKWYA